jgi:hypothetical protein
MLNFLRACVPLVLVSALMRSSGSTLFAGQVR